MDHYRCSASGTIYTANGQLRSDKRDAYLILYDTRRWKR